MNSQSTIVKEDKLSIEMIEQLYLLLIKFETMPGYQNTQEEVNIILEYNKKILKIKTIPELKNIIRALLTDTTIVIDAYIINPFISALTKLLIPLNDYYFEFIKSLYFIANKRNVALITTHSLMLNAIAHSSEPNVELAMSILNKNFPIFIQSLRSIQQDNFEKKQTMLKDIYNLLAEILFVLAVNEEIFTSNLQYLHLKINTDSSLTIDDINILSNLLQSKYLNKNYMDKIFKIINLKQTIFTLIEKHQFDRLEIENALLQKLGTLKSLSLAEKLYQELTTRTNSASQKTHAVMIQIYVGLKLLDKAKKIYQEQKFTVTFKHHQIDLHNEYGYGTIFIGVLTQIEKQYKDNVFSELKIIYGKGKHTNPNHCVNGNHPAKLAVLNVIEHLKTLRFDINGHENINNAGVYHLQLHSTLAMTSNQKNSNAKNHPPHFSSSPIGQWSKPLQVNISKTQENTTNLNVNFKSSSV